MQQYTPDLLSPQRLCQIVWLGLLLRGSDAGLSFHDYDQTTRITYARIDALSNVRGHVVSMLCVDSVEEHQIWLIRR